MLRILHAAIGVLLLVAGIGKLLALLGPVETLGWPTWLVVLGGSVEVLLGTALKIGYARRAIHLITLATFGRFSILSLIQTLRGVESCGCLARLHVHPAWMLTFDLILVIVLATLMHTPLLPADPQILDPGPTDCVVIVFPPGEEPGPGEDPPEGTCPEGYVWNAENQQCCQVLRDCVINAYDGGCTKPGDCGTAPVIVPCCNASCIGAIGGALQNGPDCACTRTTPANQTIQCRCR